MWQRRERWLDKQYANVDGIAFQMPVGTKASPALYAAFSIDPVAAQAMLPGRELHAARLWAKGVLMIAVVDYQDTTIGTYVEFCVGILCSHGRSPAPRLLSAALPPLFGSGIYIHDLPVSTEVSVKGGLGIWGMPKCKANLDFRSDDKTASSQYDMDGELVVRIDVPVGKPVVPLMTSGSGYGSFRGMLGKSRIKLRGWSSFGIGGKGVTLVIGDHPKASKLKSLDINPKALFAGYVPKFSGILDDHIETWFLAHETPPPPPEKGLRNVVSLGISQERLAPPDRERSDAMIRRFNAEQLVGRVARPG
jgi:Acetoacetate decarboxylase (ADC)